MSASCQNCRFRLPDPRPDYADHGNCRRFPPAVFAFKATDGSGWNDYEHHSPWVHPNDWCGEFSAQGIETAKPARRETGSTRKGESPVAEGHAPNPSSSEPHRKEESMSIAMQAMKLKSWQVPNFAGFDMPPGLRQDGMKPLPTIAIADLDQSALDDLAAEWLAELYAKAGKPSPFERHAS